MPAFSPTAEQQAIVDAFTAGGNIVVTAGAGAGKTSTLRLLAEAAPDRRGLYAAFNKAAQTDAAKTFPKNVNCVTSAALARRFYIGKFGSEVWDARNPFDAPRQSGIQVARILGVIGPHRISADKVLAPQQVTRIALETVQKWCFSADPDLTPRHVPQVNGVSTTEERGALVAVVLPLARKAWAEVCKPWGQINLSFDHAMKMWALSGETRLPYDFIVVDEYQDTNAAWAQIVGHQDCQAVAVGDANQAIYGWRGAIDALTTFDAEHKLSLTQSWRFGPVIAAEANKWLSLLNSDLRITGSPHINSRFATLMQADAVLCRTNAEAMVTVMDYQNRGINVALVGGGDQIERLAKAAIQLKDTGSTSHPELCAFTSWGAVQEYTANDHGGSDLAVFVKLIDDHGPEAVIRAASRTVNENNAEAIVSTAHKAKGREWASVRIAGDFPEPREDEFGQVAIPADGDLMLAYVAVTRAREVLDRTGLAWVDKLTLGHHTIPDPIPAPITPPAQAPAASGDGRTPQYRVLDATGAPLTDWTESYTDASAALRGMPNADRLDIRTTAHAAA